MTLRLTGIDCFYGNVQVLRQVSVEVAPGEVLCLLGRNGAGKTTLLKTMIGLVKPRAGAVKQPSDTESNPNRATHRRHTACTPIRRNRRKWFLLQKIK